MMSKIAKVGVVFLAAFSSVVRGEEAVEEAQGGEAQGEEGVKLEDSATELAQKLEQLKALLDAKGDSADPDLKARLAGLSGQLASLGLGDMAENLGGGGLPQSKELTEFLTVCVGLSMKQMTGAGGRGQANLALKLLAKDKLKPEQAKTMDMWKLTATCINELTEEELQQFKKKKLSKLPKAHVENAKKPEAEKQVLELDEQIWGELKVIATAMVGDEEEPAPPIIPGILAGVLFLGAVGFLGKKFMDMQSDKGDKKDKKKREGKKSK